MLFIEGKESMVEVLPFKGKDEIEKRRFVGRTIEAGRSHWRELIEGETPKKITPARASILLFEGFLQDKINHDK